MAVNLPRDQDGLMATTQITKTMNLTRTPATSVTTSIGVTAMLRHLVMTATETDAVTENKTWQISVFQRKH